MKTERNLDLLFQLGSLRNIPRAWKQYYGLDVASDLEHTMRVIFTALALARMEKAEIDELMLLKMAILHDVAESVTGDLTPIQKKYATIDEERAIEDTFKDTFFNEAPEILKRYVKRECLESKLVKDADNLDIDIELAEIKAQGHKMVEKWQPGRQKLRSEKLYTESARQLWDAIQKHDPSNWQDTVLL